MVAENFDRTKLSLVLAAFRVQILHPFGSLDQFSML